MIKLTDLLREASIVYGNTTVYALKSLDQKYVELFKVKDFPAIKKGSDAFANGTFRTMLDKITRSSYSMSLDEYLSKSGEEFAKKEINDEISNLTSFNKVYLYPDEDMIFITNSLDRFGDGYKTEEDWGLGEDREWVEI
jgi:hypothetical protein